MIFGTIPTHPDAPAFSRDSCLTKREWFAGLVMQGLSANAQWAETDVEDVAETAVNQADALIEQLNKEKV